MEAHESYMSITNSVLFVRLTRKRGYLTNPMQN